MTGVLRAQWSTVPAAPPIRLPIPNPNPNPEFQFQDFRTREIACHLICQFFCSLSLSLCLHFNGHLPGGPGLACTRMSPFCIFFGAKGDGDGVDNCSYKTCKAPVKMSPSTNQHPVFLQARCLSCRPTNSAKALKEKVSAVYCFYNPKPWFAEVDTSEQF